MTFQFEILSRFQVSARCARPTQTDELCVFGRGPYHFGYYPLLLLCYAKWVIGSSGEFIDARCKSISKRRKRSRQRKKRKLLLHVPLVLQFQCSELAVAPHGSHIRPGQ